MADQKSTGNGDSEHILDQPIRRKFKPEYKLKILQEIDDSDTKIDIHLAPYAF